MSSVEMEQLEEHGRMSGDIAYGYLIAQHLPKAFDLTILF